MKIRERIALLQMQLLKPVVWV